MISDVFARRAANNGVPKAYPLNWKKDGLVITGGQGGIGKAIVEVLSRRHQARIVDRDLAPPTYMAAKDCAPPIPWIKME